MVTSEGLKRFCGQRADKRTLSFKACNRVVPMLVTCDVFLELRELKKLFQIREKSAPEIVTLL